MFSLRHFTLHQDRCAMKVTTDAILFGAWCGNVGAQHILDIGAGTGLLSLMMAQHHLGAQVIGVELDEAAAKQAEDNVANSPFRKRVSIRQTAIQSFQAEVQFDLVVCNPPFFQNHLVSGVQNRGLARHDVALTLSELVDIAEKLLHANGRFQVMLPTKEAESLRKLIQGKFWIEKKCLVSASSDKPPHRQFLSLTKESVSTRLTQVAIKDSGGNYTQEFYDLTIPFLEDRYFTGKMPA